MFISCKGKQNRHYGRYIIMEKIYNVSVIALDNGNRVPQ